MEQSQRIAALLAFVESYRSARCAELMAAAQAEARALLKRAHAEARERVRCALEQERQHAERQLALAAARARTRARLREQRRRAQELSAAWRLLPAALEARWEDPDARARWAAAVATRSLALLPPHGWRVAHPPDWSTSEREAFVQLLAPRLEEPPQFAADPAIRAGLRLAAGATVLDATPAGLLADREAIEARLLHYLCREAP